MQEGEGFRDNLKFWAKQTPAGRAGLFLSGPRKHASHRLQQFLDENKGKKVKSMHVGRKPIVSAVHKALDAISFGGFSKTKKRLGYDDVYHHYILAGLEDGSVHKIEKNHVIEHFKATNDDFSHGLLDVPIEGVDMDLNTVIQDAGARDNPDFWVYRGGHNNCQYFTRDIVDAVERKKQPGDEKLDQKKRKEFLEPQDGTALLGSIPSGLSWIPDAVTNFAASADRATSLVANGIGQKKRKRKINKARRT